MVSLARKVTKKQWHSGKVDRRLHSICYPRLPHTGKNSSDLLPLLFPFSHQNYARYLTQHHAKLKNLSKTNSQAFSELETFGLGASLSVN